MRLPLDVSDLEALLSPLGHSAAPTINSSFCDFKKVLDQLYLVAGVLGIDDHFTFDD